MKKIILATLFAFGLSNSAFAAVQNLNCTLNSWEEQGWVPDRILFSVDPEAKQARVFDGNINEVEGKPITAKFKIIRGGKYRMSWKLDLITTTGTKMRANYTATYDPKSTKFNVRVHFPMANLANSPSGDGSCKDNKGQSLF